MKKIYIRGWHGLLPAFLSKRIMDMGAVELTPFYEYSLTISGLDAFMEGWKEKFLLYSAFKDDQYDYFIGVTQHGNFGQRG